MRDEKGTCSRLSLQEAPRPELLLPRTPLTQVSQRDRPVLSDTSKGQGLLCAKS